MTTNLEQLVEKGLQYEKIEKEKASERKALTRKNGLKSDEAKHIQNQKGQTRDIVAKMLGISGRQWDRMKCIYMNKEILTEQEYADWCVGNISTSMAFQKIERIRKTENQYYLIDDYRDRILMDYAKLPDEENRFNTLKRRLPLYKCSNHVKEEITKVLSEYENEFQKQLDKYNDDVILLLELIKDMKSNLK